MNRITPLHAHYAQHLLTPTPKGEHMLRYTDTKPPRPIPRGPRHHQILVSGTVAVLIVAGMGIIGYTSGYRDGGADGRQARSEATSAIATAKAEHEYLLSVEASLTAAYARIAELEAAPAAEAKAAPSVQAPAAAQPRVEAQASWDAEQVRATLAVAASEAGLEPADAVWIIETGVVVAHRESGYDAACVTGDCVGLFQFDSGWGSDAERLDPVWSCYRFVQAYVDGGRANIRKHWAATIGGM